MLTNCKKCGALYLKKDQSDICEKCITQEQELIKSIIKFVKRNQNEYVSFDEISNETGASINDLESFLLKGKLLQIADKIIMNCKACGSPVKGIERKNLFCNKCMKNF